jgi:hypothetical protein
MYNIPDEYLDTPVYLKFEQTGRYLQDDGRLRADKCLMVLTRVPPGFSSWGRFITIKSVSHGSLLRVHESGLCNFLRNNNEASTHFRVESVGDESVAVFFVSRSNSNALECGERSNDSYCLNKKVEPRKAWMIIFPERDEEDRKPKAKVGSKVKDVANKPVESKGDKTTKPKSEDSSTETRSEGSGLHIGNLHIPQTPLRIAAGVAVGVAAVPLLGMAAAAAVPAAMSTFGTVVAGVGTIHAPFAAGGVAATLQVAAGTLATTGAVAVGGAVGAAVGAATLRRGGNHASNPENGTDGEGTVAEEEVEDKEQDLNDVAPEGRPQ